MIKLLYLLVLISSLNAEHHSFIFPDDKHRFFHALKPLFSSSETLYIASKNFASPQLNKFIQTRNKSAKETIIISSALKDDTGYLVQFKNLFSYRYTKRLMHGTLLTDSSITCFISADLDENALANERSFGVCTDNPDIVSKFFSEALRLKSQSVPYLN